MTTTASSNEMNQTAAIFGATGAVGMPLVSHLLSSPNYSTVHAFVRRPFKQGSVYKDEIKLQEHIIDFEKLVNVNQDLNTSSEVVKMIKEIKASAIYITLGTTRAQAGSSASFVKIDRDYVIAGAKAALIIDKDKDESSQRLLYCSSAGANPSSRMPYLQSKGLTEESVSSLGYSECILFRPGYLSGAQRERTRFFEKIFGSVMTNIGGRISDNAEIQVSDVAKAMAIAGQRGIAGLNSNQDGITSKQTQNGGQIVLINNVQAKKLAREM